MENVNGYESENYQKGELTPNSWSQSFDTFIKNLVFGLQITLIFISEPFVAIWMAFRGIFKSSGRNKIEGQVALVTGSANGLGRAIALRLAQEKCQIAVADINFVDAQKTARDISETFGVKAIAFKVDVSDVSSIKQLKVDIESSLGPVDILVNNAGILCMASLREFTDEQLKKVLEVNLMSHFWTVREFIDGMIERKRGRIVAIASLAAKLSIPIGITYSTTKAAVKSFMDVLYEELHCYGHEKYVRLLTVLPGFIATRKELTDMLDKTFEFVPRLTVEEVADETVVAMLKNKREIILPRIMGLITFIINNLPPRSYIMTKTKLYPHTSMIESLSKIKSKNFGVENE